ncbi:sodium:calcium antiporter [Halomonas sp. 18H]|uniref:sodium:calcium antiporter n=1 Tax=Halomonas almeriensis TaxID=308163 RepID=UPI00222FFBC2|nr:MULTISPECIES: sodium:calcium antiporter [Halomonas]MCW4152961.1 sodium:calcium antiporter [Halomonas sp. 18H]MDN3553111.1 sodium:calcium antiporter [Halomonas almeriensis]
MLTNLPLGTAITLFLGCTLVIGVAGTKLTRIVDDLADRTGLGEAIAGAVLLGMATSLSGLVLSVSAALDDKPTLAMSNALGGIAVQTLFLTIADLVHRRANLEHAAASIGNLMQGGLLLCLLSLVLVGRFAPEWTLWQVHPITPLLLIAYLYGLRLADRTKDRPMWRPANTRETQPETPDEQAMTRSALNLWLSFIGLALALAVSGFLLERAASVIASATGLGQSVVGALMTAVVTSLPELVTSVAAVRRGALTLAVAGIIGGNAFDTLFVAASDVAYRGGSIYHAIADPVALWVALSLLMTAILMVGMIHREREGPGRIGFESLGIALCYLVGALSLVFTSG